MTDHDRAVSELYYHLLPTLEPGDSPAELRAACLLYVAELA